MSIGSMDGWMVINILLHFSFVTTNGRWKKFSFHSMFETMFDPKYELIITQTKHNDDNDDDHHH